MKTLLNSTLKQKKMGEKKKGGAAGSGTNNKKKGSGKHKSGGGSQLSKSSTKFTGSIEQLKGKIFDYGVSRTEEIYADTTKEIAGYVGRTFSEGGVMKTIVETLEYPTLPMPSDPPDNATLTEKKVWEEKVKLHVRSERDIELGVTRLWSVVWGQCTEAMKAKLEGMPDHERIKYQSDGIRLLKNIRTTVYQFQKQKKNAVAMHMAKRKFYTFSQKAGMSNHEYLEKFKTVLEVLESNGAEIGTDEALVDTLLGDVNLTRTSVSDSQLELIRKRARDSYLAVAFLMGADRGRYGLLIQDLENSFTQGTDKYPKDIVSAYHLLSNWKNNPSYLAKVVGSVEDGVAFTTQGTAKGKGKARQVKCYRCQKTGHIAPYCRETTNANGEDIGPNEGGANDRDDGAAMAQTEDDDDSSSESSKSGEERMQEGTANTAVGTGDRDWFDDDGFAFATGHVFSGTEKTKIPNNWILLDNQSTVNVFRSKELLRNIRKIGNTMKIRCNAGHRSTNMVGELPGFGTVWYMPDGIANILSLSRVRKRYRVTFDSWDGNQFVVHKDDGSRRIFKEHMEGLYYLDVKREEGTSLVSTVADKKSRYTNRDYSQAVLARKLQNVVGRPSMKTFLEMVENKWLPNCPISRDDVAAADDIFGPNVGSLKGKTVRRTPEHVRGGQVNIPRPIVERYRDITLCGDIMFVNKVPFLVTISRNINFRTAAVLRSRQAKIISRNILAVKKLYSARGFRVHTLNGDYEFEAMRGDLMDGGVHLNAAAKDEHVPEIERSIRVVKERARSVYNTLPFSRIPFLMLAELVYSVTFWLNCFPPDRGIGGPMSPREIITGVGIDYHKHCQLEFGEYVQTHEEHDNSLSTRTVGAIALRPTGNLQGGHYFMSLSTGRRITRYAWTPLPMPKEVILRVNHLAALGQAHQELLFHFSNGASVDDDSDDDDYDPDEDPESDKEMSEYETDESDEEASVEITGVNEPGVQNNNTDLGTDTPDMDGESTGVDGESTGVAEAEADGDVDNDTDTTESETTHQDQQDELMDENEEDPMDESEDFMRKRYGERNDFEHNLRPRKKPRYVLAQKEVIINKMAQQNAEVWAKLQPRSLGRLYRKRLEEAKRMQHVMNEVLLTQYPVGKGLKVFGQPGVDAVKSEMKQLVDMGVMDPVRKSMMTAEESQSALPYLMFLKQKRSGKIKGRGCADGRRQRLYKSKEETSSPTVMTESVFITAAIDAMEGRHVVTVDVPGAFMQTDVDEKIHIRLEGPMVKLLCQVDPRYKKYVVNEKGKPVVYAKLRKALYGTLQASYLFWKDITRELEKDGFEVNPYDWCVANKTVDGKQCTVTWHVDDLKISCVDRKPIDELVEQLNQRYGKFKQLTINDSKVHDYLGMTLDYTKSRKVQVSMLQYVDELLGQCPDDMNGTSITPAGNNLFEVNEDDEPLDIAKREVFHHLTAKLLYLSRRARPDIQTAVAFLTTRVASPGRDDWKKLCKCIKYLRGSKGLVLTLEAGAGLNMAHWYVDGAFAVHRDMRSHTGVTMTLGKGAVLSGSSKQKLNTRSSTEAELIAVDEAMGMIMWTRNFLHGQGYSPEMKLAQDNMSAMLLEKNGKASSGRRTRHLNIRHFFITDRIHQGEVSVVYCPTDDMVADVLTKPLQGSKFRKFRRLLLNLEDDDA